jgi:hypothetical protein
MIYGFRRLPLVLTIARPQVAKSVIGARHEARRKHWHGGARIKHYAEPNARFRCQQ